MSAFFGETTYNEKKNNNNILLKTIHYNLLGKRLEKSTFYKMPNCVAILKRDTVYVPRTIDVSSQDSFS